MKHIPSLSGIKDAIFQLPRKIQYYISQLSRALYYLACGVALGAWFVAYIYTTVAIRERNCSIVWGGCYFAATAFMTFFIFDFENGPTRTFFAIRLFITGVKDAGLQLPRQIQQYISSCSRTDYVRASVVAAVVGYAVVMGSSQWAHAAFVLFSLVNGPTRTFFVDLHRLLYMVTYTAGKCGASYGPMGSFLICLCGGFFQTLLDLFLYLKFDLPIKALLGIRTPAVSDKLKPLDHSYASDYKAAHYDFLKPRFSPPLAVIADYVLEKKSPNPHAVATGATEGHDIEPENWAFLTRS